MDKLTRKERFIRTFQRKDIDRIAIVDSPWAGTIARWQREGMPKDVDWIDYFGVDKTVGFGVDNSPRFETKTIEETDEYVIYTNNFGATLKSFKVMDSSPEFLGFTINCKDEWLKAKKRMNAESDRINWTWIKDRYDQWKTNDEMIYGHFWFGFDVTHSWAVGTETLLIAMYEDPEWAMDMFNHYLNIDIELFTKIWDAGYHFDAINWPDDMGYKGTQFFSVDMYRDLIKPYHKKAVEFAHERGAYVDLHSCGNILPFIPELIEIGIDCLNPIEVKAGMDPIEIKRKFGDKLVLKGGINAVLWDDVDEISNEMRRLIPVLKENQGYIFQSDHSIPNSVSLENMKEIVKLAKELGRY